MSENEEIKDITAGDVKTDDTPAPEAETNKEPAEAAEITETPAPEAEKKPEKEKAKGKNPFRSKKFKRGSLSIVFTLLFIAGIVLVNVIANLILDRFNIEADLTAGSVFTLGAETENYIRSVNDDISFYVTAERDSLAEAGTMYKQTVEFLDRMVSLNSRFSLRYVNLLTEPDFSNRFVEDLTNYEVIVESGNTGRYRILPISDFMKYTLSDGNQYSYSEASMYVNYYGYTVSDIVSFAEEQLVSAIQSVSLEDPAVVTFLTGYGETDSSSLEKLLTNNAYVTKKAEIERVEEVPAETDILVIFAPSKDYSLESVTKVDKWLSNGGKYGKTLIYVASPDADETPNLDEYLAEWGLEVGKGYILQFDNSHVYYTTSSIPIMHDLEMKTDTDYFTNMKYNASSKLVGYYVRPVTTLWDEKGNFYHTTIASAYGDKCLVYPFSADAGWSPSESDLGSYDVIVEASKVQFEGGSDPVFSKIVAVGGDQLFADYFTTASNYSNGEAALTLFDTNSEKNSDTIKIVEKSFSAETYQIDRSTQLTIGIIFAVVIPIIIIIVGIVVWARRRRL